MLNHSLRGPALGERLHRFVRLSWGGFPISSRSNNMKTSFSCSVSHTRSVARCIGSVGRVTQTCKLESGDLNLHRLFRVGPVTVAAAVLAVLVVQKASLEMLGPIPGFAGAVLNSREPAIVTAVLVAAAVLAFAVVGNASTSPVRTFKRLAMVVLLVSFIPNVAMAWSGAGWPPMIALMAMHVLAWAVTVTMLTRLTARRQGAGR